MNSARFDPAATHAVIGLGLTGRSCVRYLRRQGATVLAADTRAAPPALGELRAEYPDLEFMLGSLDAARLARVPTLVVSPGIALAEPALRAAAAAGCEIVGDVELFARAARAPLIAITGTNGKSTVTTLVGELLAASGRTVRVGGNLGPPALDLLAGAEPACHVLELSSFQLDLTTSLAPRVAAILNITPDHLDRHGAFADYVQSKARILERAASAVLNADDAVTAQLACAGRRIEFTLGTPGAARYGLSEVAGETVLAGPHGALLGARELALAGRHNLANALAALAIVDAFEAADGRAATTPPAALLEALRRFRGLPHRAEPVAHRAGVAYVNDSKATNPGAAMASVEGLLGARGGVVIAGGEAKGAAFAEFAACLARHAHTAVLLGRAAPLIEAALGGRIACVTVPDMPAAVAAAARAARPGELVLLAPACASFDLFDDYAHRGAAFRAAVHALGGG